MCRVCFSAYKSRVHQIARFNGRAPQSKIAAHRLVILCLAQSQDLKLIPQADEAEIFCSPPHARGNKSSDFLN